MGKQLNLIGQRFGKLEVIEKSAIRRRKSIMWVCRCDCGNNTIAASNDLRSGEVRSCGCMKHRFTTENASGMNNPSAKHNLRNHKLYPIWKMMKQRCYNPHCGNYKYYGGRGITVCQEWRKDFKVFYDWAISHGYQDGLSIDRIDVNGNYEPANCRWITMAEQNRNKRK